MKKIIFIGLFSFLVAALLQLPLPYAKPYAEKYVQGLKVGQTDGTIWKGSAEDFSLNNVDFKHIDWQINLPKSIQSLSLSLDFNITDVDLNIQGLASLTPKKTLILDNTNFDAGTRYLNKIQKNAKLAGEVKGSIQYAEINQKDLPHINATINWKNAAVTSPIQLPPGDYKAVITPNSEGLLAILSSFEAPAELKGNITLNKAWLYNTDINLKSKNPAISPMLGFLGEKRSDGSIQIKRTGNLQPLLKK